MLTSNRTRELHDTQAAGPLPVDRPPFTGARGRDRAAARAGIPERLAEEAAAFVRGLRGLDLAKPPGVAETIDWAQALAALGREEIDAGGRADARLRAEVPRDIEAVRDETLVGLIEEARAASGR